MIHVGGVGELGEILEADVVNALEVQWVSHRGAQKLTVGGH